MSDSSAIEWTDATLNVVTGCTKVSPGCANCYIVRTMPFRTKGRKFVRVGNTMATGVELHPDRFRWLMQKKWQEPRRIFVNSLSDLWHEDIPFEFVDSVFALMNEHKRHTYQILTKRPERMLEWWQRGGTELWEHVWLGVSVENARFTYRADLLREIPAAVRFISAEPLLDSLFVPGSSAADVDGAAQGRGHHESVGERQGGQPGTKASLDLTGIDWVIAGGESGPGYRPLNVEHARELRDACDAAGVAYFFKQHGGPQAKSGGKELDGEQWCQFPTDQIGVPERYMALV